MYIYIHLYIYIYTYHMYAYVRECTTGAHSCLPVMRESTGSGCERGWAVNHQTLSKKRLLEPYQSRGQSWLLAVEDSSHVSDTQAPCKFVASTFACSCGTHPFLSIPLADSGFRSLVSGYSWVKDGDVSQLLV